MGTEVHPHGFQGADGLGRRVHWAGALSLDGVVVSMTLQHCPLCGAEPYVAETEGEDGHHGLAVACPSCGLAAPESREGCREDAVRAWGYLCSRMCSHCRTHLIRRIRELKNEIATLNQKLGERQ